MFVFYFSLLVVFCECSTSCWNGGFMNSTSWCDCPILFRNSDPVPGRCDFKTCCNRGNISAENYCSCNSGWEGVDCELCNDNSACQPYFDLIGKTYEDEDLINCRHASVFSYQNMNFVCDITDPLMASYVGTIATFQCTNVGYAEGAEGDCVIETWGEYTYDGVPNYQGQTMWCEIKKCSAELTTDETIFYKCEETYCYPVREHSPHAGKMTGGWLWPGITTELTGWSEVECQKSGTCSFRQEGLSFSTFDMKCRGSECLDKDYPIVFPEKPTVDIALIVSIYLVINFCCYCCCCFCIIDCFLIAFSQLERHRLRKYDTSGGELDFKDIKYYINVFKDGGCCKAERMILRGISFKIESGTLCSVMGATGAGKTTLLDILARRNKSGLVTGKIKFNTHDPGYGWTFKRLTGYVVQEDYLMETMTVQEAIMFSADLRLPLTLCDNQKRKICDNVMKELGIYKIKNSRIGGMTKRGISGGERKRVSVALELVVNPHLLFLDEPTSGLDASTAHELVSVLKRLTLRHGRTIVMSIHQPRAKIFRLFDTLVLLSGGNLVYGGRASGVVTEFEHRYEEKFPGGTENPADWVLDLVCRDEREIESRRRKLEESHERELGNPLVFNPKKNEIEEKKRLEEKKIFELEKTIAMKRFGKRKRRNKGKESGESVELEMNEMDNREEEDHHSSNDSIRIEEINNEEDEQKEEEEQQEEEEEGGEEVSQNSVNKPIEEEQESSNELEEEEEGEEESEIIDINNEEEEEEINSNQRDFPNCRIYLERKKEKNRNSNKKSSIRNNNNNNKIHENENEFGNLVYFGEKKEEDDDVIHFSSNYSVDGRIRLFEDGIKIMYIEEEEEETITESFGEEEEEQQQQQLDDPLIIKVEEEEKYREVSLHFKNITDVFTTNLLKKDDDGDDSNISYLTFQVEWKNTYVVVFPSKLIEDVFMKQFRVFSYCELQVIGDQHSKKGEKKKKKKKGCGSLISSIKNLFRKSSKTEDRRRKNEEEEEKFFVIEKENIIVFKDILPLMPFATTFSTQIWYLSQRSLKHFIRNYYLLPMHIGSALIIGVLMGLIYWDSNMNISGAQNRLGMLFFMCAVMSFTAMSGLEIFIRERPLFMRERSNKYYFAVIYYIVKVGFDLIPLRVIPPLIMGSICYFMIGLNPDFVRFVNFLGLVVLFNILSGAMCIFIGTISSSVSFANIFATLVILLNSVFGGFLVNRNAMPAWISWVRYFSYWNYVFENLVINEFNGRVFSLSDEVGLSLDLSIQGDGVLDILGMEKGNYGVNVMVSILFAVFSIILSGVIVLFYVKERK